MANYALQFRFQLTDVNGDSAHMTLEQYVADTQTLAVMATTASNLATTIAACTNAKITSQGVFALFLKAQISSATAPPPANATYPSVTDGAQLHFQNSAGEKRTTTIPAPLLSNFKTGTDTVNPSDTNVSAFISIIEGLPDVGGATNLYNGGSKVSHHARKRVSHKSL